MSHTKSTVLKILRRELREQELAKLKAKVKVTGRRVMSDSAYKVIELVCRSSMKRDRN